MDPNNQPSQEPQSNPPTPAPLPTESAPVQPPAYQPVTSQTPGQPSAAQDPGKGLAIAGIILAFFFSLVGLILSIVAKKKSKAAGFHNTLATVGIILNSIFLALALIVIPIFIAITITAYNGVQERAKASAGLASANLAIKKSDAYYALNDIYPTTAAEFESSSSTSLKESEIFLASSPLSATTAYVSDGETGKTYIELYECNKEGNKVGYWDGSLQSTRYLYSGNASAASTCTLIH